MRILVVEKYTPNIKKMEQYVVKLVFNDEHGSGVILKVNEDIAVVFTVRHLFESQLGCFSEINQSSLLKFEIDSKSLYITNFNNIEFSLYSNIIFCASDKDLDFCFFVLKNNDFLNNLIPIKIYSDDVTTYPNHVLGYSMYRHKNDIANKCESLKFSFHNRSKFDLELNHSFGSLIHADEEEKIIGITGLLKGMSGGGSFISIDEDIYLVGIQKKALRSSLVVVNFIGDNDELLQLINDSLINLFRDDNKEIKIQSIIENDLNINDLRLDLNESWIDDLESHLKSKGKALIHSENEALSFQKECDDFVRDVKKQLDSVADEYLNIAIYQYKNNNYIKAGRSLRKAVLHNKSYGNMLIGSKISKGYINKGIYQYWLNDSSKKIVDNIWDYINKLDKIIRYEEEIIKKNFDEEIFVNLCFNIKDLLLILNEYPGSTPSRCDLINKFHDILEIKYKNLEFIEDRFYELLIFYKDIQESDKFLKNAFILLELLRRRDEKDSFYYKSIQIQVNEYLSNIKTLVPQELKNIQNDAHEYINDKIIEIGGADILLYQQEVRYLKDKIKRLEENSTQ